MGRSAHAGSARNGESISAMSQLEPLLAEIASLLAQAEVEDDPVRLERTLTDGYARALSIEAERSRLQRRIGQITESLGRNGTSQISEISLLATRLDAQACTLEHLRDELGRLRQRHSDAVRAAVR